MVATKGLQGLVAKAGKEKQKESVDECLGKERKPKCTTVRVLNVNRRCQT